ncbi:hypothetical protein MYX75_01095 [Acidobacteria bacterium AH-259-A15]|nr:hypothetical protein [Acidobacteria bacterium AH-259-A15]
MSAFDYAFQKTNALEGGYVDHPKDRGGRTKFGISQRSYPDEDVANLTVERAKFLAKRDYWDRLRLDRILDDEVSAEIYDTAFNMGPGTAVKIAQRAVNYFGETLKVDGIIGPKTNGAINRWCLRDARSLLKALNGVQFMHFLAIVEGNPDQAVFSRGWLKRVQV